MRALRIATMLLSVLALSVGSAVAAAATDQASDITITPVAGTLTVHQLPGGTFDVENRIFQYRDFPLAGSSDQMTDTRLDGDLLSEWSWDVQASGDRPVPAWGTITIHGEDGSWSGDFTGIRKRESQPLGMRALLFGEGAYEGMCATLDIAALDPASGGTWVVDGIIHPVDMAG